MTILKTKVLYIKHLTSNPDIVSIIKSYILLELRYFAGIIATNIA